MIRPRKFRLVYFLKFGKGKKGVSTFASAGSTAAASAIAADAVVTMHHQFCGWCFYGGNLEPEAV